MIDSVLFLFRKMDPTRQVFTMDLLERHAAKGHGVITCMAAGNDVIILGTSKGWVIRHDFGAGDSYGIFFCLYFLWTYREIMYMCILFNFFVKLSLH